MTAGLGRTGRCASTGTAAWPGRPSPRSPTRSRPRQLLPRIKRTRADTDTLYSPPVSCLFIKADVNHTHNRCVWFPRQSPASSPPHPTRTRPRPYLPGSPTAASHRGHVPCYTEIECMLWACSASHRGHVPCYTEMECMLWACSASHRGHVPSADMACRHVSARASAAVARADAVDPRRAVTRALRLSQLGSGPCIARARAHRGSADPARSAQLLRPHGRAAAWWPDTHGAWECSGADGEVEGGVGGEEGKRCMVETAPYEEGRQVSTNG